MGWAVYFKLPLAGIWALDSELYPTREAAQERVRLLRARGEQVEIRIARKPSHGFRQYVREYLGAREPVTWRTLT